jgi:hypothetical protein
MHKDNGLNFLGNAKDGTVASGAVLDTSVLDLSVKQSTTANQDGISTTSSSYAGLFNGTIGSGVVESQSMDRDGITHSKTEYGNIGGFSSEQNQSSSITEGGLTDSASVYYRLDGETLYAADNTVNVGADGLEIDSNFNCCGESCGGNCSCCGSSCFEDMGNVSASICNVTGSFIEVVGSCFGSTFNFFRDVDCQQVGQACQAVGECLEGLSGLVPD